MKYTCIALSCWAVMSINQASAADTTTLNTDKDKLSYGIGVSVGRNFKKQDTDVDIGLLVKGLTDSMAGEKLAIPEKELRRVMNAYQTEIRQKSTQTRRIAIEDNKKKGDAFLLKNKSVPGMVVLPSGVQYKIVKAGQGRKPIDSDLIVCNYRGTLLDGSEFDATEEGKPASLKLSALIAGWKEVMKLMPVGSKWQVFIPAQHAYGERGVGGDIGPNETLIFDVELLAIN
jgi:FKBP-type peptidyl-prolyl cis-trans isomerase